MTHQEIKELAGHRAVSPWVMKLVNDAVMKERESCAKVCDEREKDFMGLFHKYGYEEDSGAMLASMQCANAIRAREEKK